LAIIRFIFVVCILFAAPVAAQVTLTDPTLFEQCSKRSNLLVNLNADLDRLHTEVDDYNRRHDFLRSKLDRREGQVVTLEQSLKEKPVSSPLWDTYDVSFDLYEAALQDMSDWNQYGDKLEKKYQLAIDLVVALQGIIGAECSGTWEPAIINKFCDDISGRYSEFCKEFGG